MADPDHPVIDVWAAIADPDIPHDVIERLIDRQAAARAGRTPDPVPEDDKPHLARHIVHSCAIHDEIVQHVNGQWQHLSDHRPCQPHQPNA